MISKFFHNCMMLVVLAASTIHRYLGKALPDEPVDKVELKGQIQPIEAQDEWSLLLQDLASPHPAVRALAQATWESKRKRNAAFFEGMSFPEKPKHLRGIPQELRAGWDRDIDPAFEDDVVIDRVHIPHRQSAGHGGLDMYEDIKALAKGKSAYEQLDDLNPTVPVDVPIDEIFDDPRWMDNKTVSPNKPRYVSLEEKLEHDARDQSKETNGPPDQGSCG